MLHSKITLENAEAVTKKFSNPNRKPNKPLMWAIHHAASKIIKARTFYERGADKEIADGVANGLLMFVAHNHQAFLDPIVLCSIFQREKAFWDMRYETIIPSKASNFNHLLYGPIVHGSRSAVPFLVPNDLPPHLRGDKDIDAQRKLVNRPMISTMRSNFNNGRHGVIYPEGTRGRPTAGEVKSRDITKVQPIHDGIGEIACGVNDPSRLRLVYVGTTYGWDENDHLHPTSYVLRPKIVPATVEETVALTAVKLQHAVNESLDIDRLLTISGL